MKRALLLVDVQQDFTPGGALSVPNGDKIIPVINGLIPKFKWIVTTQDFHPKNHCSFKEQGGPWPVHCVRATDGARLHPDLINIPEDNHIGIFKGTDKEIDSYSAFFDNERLSKTQLHEILMAEGIDTLYVAGLATDYCVKFTVLDALELGYDVNVINNAVKGVNVIDAADALMMMQERGAKIVHSMDVGDEPRKSLIDSYEV
jgi:nicotinamidase/pyrazinamidase